MPVDFGCIRSEARSSEFVPIKGPSDYRSSVLSPTSATMEAGSSDSVATPIPSTEALSDPGSLTRVYLIRHGETQENRDGIIQGQRNTQLNATGIEQARLVGDALKGVEFGRAFSSDLDRAVKVRYVI